MSGHRDWATPSEEHQPVTWFRGYPVYAAHLLMAILVATMFITAAFQFGGGGGYLSWLIFDGQRVIRGEVWRIATFGFVNTPSIRFGIDMLMLVYFGRDVERFLGRRRFLLLFAAVYFVAPVVLTILAPWAPFLMAGKVGVLGVFVAYAVLFPNAPVFFNLAAKWAAICLAGILLLMALAERDVPLLISTVGGCGIAYAFTRHAQGHFTLPSFTLFKRKPKLRVLPDLPAKKRSPASPTVAAEPADSPMAELDALLDKIAKSGIASLTPRERATLEAARADLLKRQAEQRR